MRLLEIYLYHQIYVKSSISAILEGSVRVSLKIFPHPDYLLIGSLGKVSFYSKEGKFIKERKVPVFGQMTGMYQPIGVKNDTLYQLVENEDEEEWELHAVELE